MIVTPEAPVNAVNNRASDERDDREAAGQPAEQRLRQAHQPRRRLPALKQESREREQRNRDEHRRFGQAEELDRDDR